ncbi:MAG TPA: hypothetical protein ENO08_05300, partial [Candidatus Eisenbacteria bacterium]|nr:hypothetical protein [Candidatus Eisenbacteria bacterium]
MKIPIRTNKIVIISVFAAVFAAAFIYGIRETAQFPRWTADDAYILYRYAENLAEHGELSWNPGENPVEGYTGFTLVMIISAAIKMGISPIAASHAIGIASFFIGGILLLLILRGFNIGSVTASILYFTTPFMYVHAWSGLETTLFTTTILFALYAFTIGRDRLFVASLLLLSFTRPEGVLLSVLLLAVYRPVSRSIIAAYLVPCAVYFLWRWIYYGQPLPNTFYAKASFAAPLDENVKSLRLLASKYLRMPAFLGLIFFSYECIRKRKFLIGALLAFTLISLYLYLSSDLVMNYAYRFFVPLYTLALLAVGGILLGSRRNAKTVLIAAIILLVQVSFNVNGKNLMKLHGHFSSYATLLEECHIEIGNYLRDNLPPDEWIVVHADAGAIPYYSKLKTRDFGRLNDEYLARKFPIELERIRRNDRKARKPLSNQNQEGAEKEEKQVETDLVDYFFAGSPGALVFTSYSDKSLSHGPEVAEIKHDPRLDDYRLLKVYKSSARINYCEYLYLRKDLVGRGKEARVFDRKLIARDSQKGKVGRTPRIDADREPPGDRGISPKESVNRRIVSKKATGISAPVDRTPPPPDSLWARAGRETDPRMKIELYNRLLDMYADDPLAASAHF